jgi:hypothetical protein
MTDAFVDFFSFGITIACPRPRYLYTVVPCQKIPEEIHVVVQFSGASQTALTVGISLFALLVNLASPSLGSPSPVAAQQVKTASPIKQVIVIIGENRSFDHVFATYKPKHGETVSNLISFPRESSPKTVHGARIIRWRHTTVLSIAQPSERVPTPSVPRKRRSMATLEYSGD